VTSTPARGGSELIAMLLRGVLRGRGCSLMRLVWRDTRGALADGVGANEIVASIGRFKRNMRSVEEDICALHVG